MARDIEEKYGIKNQIYQCMAYNMKPLILMSTDVMNEIVNKDIFIAINKDIPITTYRGILIQGVIGKSIFKVVADMSL